MSALENFSAHRRLNAMEPELDPELDPAAEAKQSTVHPLDTEASQKRLAQLKEWWFEARTAQQGNRYQMALDEDFYDGLQWRVDEAEELNDRGQAPLVFNKISQHINWLIGTERRAKVDFKVHPRGDEDRLAAEQKTKLLKYISDVNLETMQRSEAFSEAIKAGLGWLESGIRTDPSEEPLFTRWESWRNMWYDHLSRSVDRADARYLFRSRWVDLDVAVSMFPDRKTILEAAAVSNAQFSNDDEEDLEYMPVQYDQGAMDQYAGRSYIEESFHIGNRRQRVRLVEAWYRLPERIRLLRSHIDTQMGSEIAGSLHRINGTELIPDAQDAVDMLVADGYVSVIDAIKMRVRVAIFCSGGLMSDRQSPYSHNKFPFTPIWAFKRSRDGAPYGPPRQMRDPQVDLNKRRSKALFILSTSRIIAEEDAVEDWDELEYQASLPNGIIKKRHGAELEIDTDTKLAEEHVMLMEQDVDFMESASGVTEENLGKETNAQSGKAILARSEQGSTVTAMFYDNLRLAVQQQGEIKLALIEQYYSDPKVVRLTNERGHSEFTSINMPGDDGQINDITHSKADYVVDTQDFRESMRVAATEQLTDLLAKLPDDYALSLVDLVVDQMDVRGKDEMVRRIRALNGQSDPDDENAEALTDQKRQADEAKSILEERIQQMELAEREAKTRKEKAAAATQAAETMSKAQQIATELALNPQLSSAVDSLYTEFHSGNADPDMPPVTPAAPTDTIEQEPLPNG